MIEQKLVPGRYLKWNVPAPAAYPGGDGTVVLQAPNLMAIEESTGVFTKTSNVVPMTVPHRKVHRNFQWLDFCAGKIVTSAFGTTDIITGEMSGCYIIIYRDGTNHFVAHIGTDSASEERTEAVKQGWRDYLADPNREIISGFNPARYWVGDFGNGTKDYTGGVMLAVVTTAAEFYGVIVYKASGLGKTGIRVGKARKFRSCSKTELSILPSKSEARAMGFLSATAP